MFNTSSNRPAAGQFIRLFIGLFCFFLVCGWSLSSAASDNNLLIPLRVHQGTNLIHIARKYCTSQSAWKTIARINNVKPPYIIYAESTLHIPSSLLLVQKTTARVASLSGSPRLISGSGNVVLHKGDQVLPGQTVLTGPNEYVHLIYPDSRHTRIGPESAMRLVYLMRLADDNLQAGFFLEKGKIIHQIDTPLKKNEHFQTRTPVALTGVRGTEFRLKMEDGNTGVVETLKGTVSVDASGRHLRLPKGKGTRVKKGFPPSPPHQLPAPPAAVQLKDYYRVLPVVLPAPEHDTARMIRLRITRDSKGSETIQEFTAPPGKKILIPSIADGRFFIFLTAVDRQNFESIQTGPLNLKVRTDPPAPLISRPKNDVTIFESTMTIEWLQSEQAVKYQAQLATDGEFSTVIEEQESSTPRLTTKSLEPGKYFFRVRLVTDDGFTTLYSVPVSWTILEQPDLGSGKPTINDDGSIQLQWSAITGATGYMLQVAEDKEFSRIVLDEKDLSDPSCTITSFLAPQKYFVRIRPVMEDGGMTPWSPSQVMVIDPPPFGLKDFFTILVLAVIAIL